MTVVGPNVGRGSAPTAIEVVVGGAAGRMGNRVVACLCDAPGLRLARVPAERRVPRRLERRGQSEPEAPGHPALGRDAGELAGMGRLGVAEATHDGELARV